MDTSTPFTWRHFQAEIILLCVRWYLRYPLSSLDLEEMLRERGFHVDHTTIYRPFPFHCNSEAESNLNEVTLVRISWLISMSF